MAAEDAAWEGGSKDEQRICMIAATAADCRDTIFEGESGLISRFDGTGLIEKWNRSFLELDLINGTKYKGFSAQEPERLRGPQHHRAYCDELGAWEYEDTWDQMQFGLRLGKAPRVIVATTPRPTALVRMLVKEPDTIISTGSTFDNAANLPQRQLDKLLKKYSGTRLGRQELEAELLLDTPGALWTRSMIDDAHDHNGVDPESLRGNLQRIVIGVDPSGARSAEDRNAEIGIVAAGKTGDQGVVLEDGTLRAGPNDWGRRAVAMYHRWGADAIVVENNFGGAMATHVIKTVDPGVAIIEVRASRGKWLRAEPVAALYEQARIKHVDEGLAALEDEMCDFEPESGGTVDGKSPNRLDALVWAFTNLFPPEMSDVKWYVGR